MTATAPFARFFSAVSIVALSGWAHADELVLDPIAADLGQLPRLVDVSVPRFDPALGVLQCVQMDVFVDVEGGYGFENTSSLPCSVSSHLTVRLSLTPSGTTGVGPIECQVVGDQRNEPLAAFDGMQDCRGPSGVSIPVSLQGSCGGLEMCGDDIASFIGAPGSPGTVTLDALGSFDFGSQGSPCIPVPCHDISGNFLLTVTYHYAAGTPDAATTPEDQCVDLDVVANDCPTGACDGCACTLDPSTLQLVTQPARGTAQLLGGGVVRYCPEDDVCGADAFQYRVADGDGNWTPPIDVTVTIEPENDCPVAVADAATTPEEAAVWIDVLANDFDADAGAACGEAWDASSVEITVPPAHGTAVPAPDGRVRYTPDPDHCGPDQFSYRVSDAACASNDAVVSVDVTPVNDDPVALPDAVTIAEDAMVTIPVLANDSDVDDGTSCGAGIDVSSLELLSMPSLGVAQPMVDGTVMYRATIGACGVDTFTYRVADEAGATAEAMITVTIDAVNVAPVAAPDSAVALEGQATLVPVAANDADGDEGSGCGSGLDVASILIHTPPSGGTAVPNGAGGVVYTPIEGRCAQDSFQYTIADFAGERSAPVLVQVDVQAVNECPVANDDAWSVDEGRTVTVPVLANDVDPDTGSGCGAEIVPASVTLVTGAANGTAQALPGGGVRYTPNPGFCGEDSFRYLVADADDCVSNVATVTITVAPVNACPVAVRDVTSTNEGQAVVVAVLANDSDEDDLSGCGGGILIGTVQVDVPPANGTAEFVPGGTIRYVPNEDFCGIDTFQYSVADEDGCRSNPALVRVKVSPVNVAPVAVQDTAFGYEDEPLVIEVLANDSDADAGTDCGGDIVPSTVTVVMAAVHGATTVDAAGRVVYTPEPDYCGSDQFTYQVSDAGGLTSAPVRVRLKLLPDNDCPTAVADSATTPEDTPVLIDVLANDSDPDDGTCGAGIEGAMVEFVALPLHGQAVVDASGAVLYAPDEDYCGQDGFRYSVRDAAGCLSPSTVVMIQVEPQDDCPVALDDAYSLAERDVVELDVLTNDYDPDGAGECGSAIDPSTVTIVSAPDRGSLTALPNGRVRYEGFDEECGTDEFRYVVMDESGCPSNEAVVTLTISPVNAQPIARDDFAQSLEGAAIEIDVLKSGLPEEDYDPDGNNALCGSPLDPCSVTLMTPAGSELSLGSLQSVGCGRFLYTPTDAPGAGQTWTDRFRYTVQDKEGLESDPAVVTIELLGPRPEAPVAVDDYAITDFPAPVEIDVLANDSDPNDDLLPGSLMIVDPPDCGEAIVQGGVVVFTPEDGACGECSFTYSIEDETGLQATATVTVDVHCECAIGPRDRRRPGSLLLYPQFDSREGATTFVTVTNVDTQNDVEVEFYYVNGADCSHFDRRHTLTPNDTLTVLAEYHHPNAEEGYLYVFARDPDTGVPIVHNGLIGQVLILDGIEMDGLECNAVSFRGVGAHGLPTDLDQDGVRDLNGLEYEEAPGEILIPRFFGQQVGQFESELVLVALTGGDAFETLLYFEIFNDNEVLFSREHEFTCWERLPLLDLSGATSNQFLSLLEEDDPLEILGAAGAQQAGWMRIQGDLAQSNTTVIPDPAFYAVLVERNGQGRASSDLPFEACSNANGDLSPSGLNGDTD